MPVVGLSRHTFSKLGSAAVQIAHAEGLTGHSHAVQIRMDYLRGKS
jgi:histidinol dehydrogenase